MARSWTLLQMRNRARSESDMVNSTFVSDAEVNTWINSNLCEVFDMLVQAGPPDYYSVTVQFNTSPQQEAYPLPGDFRSLAVVYSVDPNSHRKRPVEVINDWAVAQYQPPQGTYTIQMRYIPVPPILNVDSDTFDGVSGWEELICSMTARDMLMKEESDVSAMLDKIERLKGRIRTASSQRDGGPQYITNVNNARSWDWQFTDSRIGGYIVRGDNIELYEPAFWGWY